MADGATLYLTTGGTVVVTIALTSDTGAAYTVPGGHSFFALTICPYLGAKPKVKVETATVSGSNLTVTLTSAMTNYLTAGKYVGQVLFSAAGGNYVYSDPFVVVVTAKPDLDSNPPDTEIPGDDPGVF